jgi:hypothetical protein
MSAIPEWVDGATWLPRDWEDPGTECATCGCRKSRHHGGTNTTDPRWSKKACLYAGAHKAIDCRAYVEPTLTLGLEPTR